MLCVGLLWCVLISKRVCMKCSGLLVQRLPNLIKVTACMACLHALHSVDVLSKMMLLRPAA